MKKLISILSATALISSSAANVVSCGNNAFWTEFNRAIQNRETFMVYIGADDCDFCNHFEEAKIQTGDFLQTLLDGMVARYEALLLSNNPGVDNLTGFGKSVEKQDSVRLMEFVIEERADNFNERWSINILNWLRDQLREIYYGVVFEQLVNSGNIGENVARNLTNEWVGTYLNSSKGTPMFMMIRNGRLAGIYFGYNQSSSKNYRDDLTIWFQTFDDFFLAEDLANRLVMLINSANGGSPEETSAGISETTQELITYNYDEISLSNFV